MWLCKRKMFLTEVLPQQMCKDYVSISNHANGYQSKGYTLRHTTHYVNRTILGRTIPI